MTKRLRYIKFMAVLLLFLGSCSPKNNTYVIRQYHSVTAYFNVLFNGRDTYKMAAKEAEKTEPAGFDELLPVFAFVYETVPGQTSSAMHRSIEKSNKTILRHSITSKPKRKKNLTREQRQFYNKKEFNPWIDDAHLLTGKAHIYLHEYASAQKVFDQIIIDYPKELSVHETRLWQAILLLQEGDLATAENTLKLLEKHKEFPENLQPMLFAAYADLAIKQGNYPEAITRLEQILQKHQKKATKIRYNYLLAQLNEKVGNKTKALNHYQKVMKMNPPYFTAFNAELATVFASEGTANKDEIRKMLTKALKAEKNEDYKDQIYFALASLEKSDNNIEKAVEFYHKSLEESVSNNRQKALSYNALAEYYYSLPDYIKSYNYYDSATRNIGREHSRFEELLAKTNSLRRLALNMKIVANQDSLQKIGGMSVDEREKLIAAKIEKSGEVEREQAAEQQRIQEQIQLANSAANMGNSMQQATSAGKWYFYNTTALNLGFNDFQMRWGRRKLEDNWRRRNKSMNMMEDSDDFDEDDFIGIGSKEQKTGLTPQDKEFYLVDIPVGDSALIESNKLIEHAMYTIGEAYRDDLKMYKEAVIAFEAQIIRFPAGEYKPLAYVALYKMHNTNGNAEQANYYKNLMSAQYANHPQVKAALDPAYVAELQRQENAQEQAYNIILAQYLKGNHAEAYRVSNDLIANQPKNIFIPQYYLLRAMSNNYNGDKEAYGVALNEVIKKFPKNAASTSAKQLLADLAIQIKEDDNPLTNSLLGPENATVIINYSAQDSEHYFGIIVGEKTNLGKQQFSLTTYNADNYIKENLEIIEDKAGNNKILLVSAFKSKEAAMKYYNRTKNQKNIYDGLDDGSYQIFVISDINYFLFKDAGNFKSYYEFFTNQYLK